MKSSTDLVPSKSVEDFIVKRSVAFIRECGHEMSKITLKTDQEPAILDLVENVTRFRAALGAEGTVPENSPTYSHQANGVIERGVQTVEGIIRTLRSALEERMGRKLEIGDAIWPWLVECASYLSNRCEVGHDGKTAYERLKGKKAKVQGIEFGETVMWKRRPIGDHSANYQ